MALTIQGEYNSTIPNYTIGGKQGKLQMDAHGNLQTKQAATVVSSGSEIIAAKATGSTGDLGKLATIANTVVTYIRASASGYQELDWRIQSDAVYTVQKYKSHTIANSVDVTLNAIADTNTLIINGYTITFKAASANATYASRYCRVDAASDDLDAVELAKLINADYAVVTAGTSIAATDKLVITTDEGAHTIVAKASSADYTTGQYLLNAVVATELASIVLAINHTQNVTCTTADATGETVTINGKVYTGAAAEDLTTNSWHADSANASTAATSLAACINSATYGNTDLTAVASSAVVYLYRKTKAATITLTSSSAVKLACVTTVGGVPGVSAVATGYAGELAITPTWTKTLTVTEAGDQLTVTDIDIPGILATAGTAKVTLTPGTPAGVTGELAPLIQATGTATRTVISEAGTLANLTLDGDAKVDEVANSTSKGKIYSQVMRGWEYGYIGVTNKSGGAAQTLVVGVTDMV